MPQLARYKLHIEGLKDIPEDHFKRAFIEYLETNEEDLLWEGFAQRELHGFGRVLNDFVLYGRAVSYD
jgi:hypothetical protein